MKEGERQGEGRIRLFWGQMKWKKYVYKTLVRIKWFEANQRNYLLENTWQLNVSIFASIFVLLCLFGEWRADYNRTKCFSACSGWNDLVLQTYWSGIITNLINVKKYENSDSTKMHRLCVACEVSFIGLM